MKAPLISDRVPYDLHLSSLLRGGNVPSTANFYLIDAELHKNITSPCHKKNCHWIFQQALHYEIQTGRRTEVLTVYSNPSYKQSINSKGWMKRGL